MELMGPTRDTKVDLAANAKPVATVKGVRVNESPSKTFFQNRVTKGEKLMFVRRENIADEKKAIFMRVTNIVISCSANNDTVRVIKNRVSSPSSRASTPSVPGTPKRPWTAPKKKQQTKNYIGMLQRHRKSSFASLLEHYSTLDDDATKESQKKGLSLEDEVRQIDTFFNNLSSKKESNVTKSKVHVKEDDFEIARLWKDLGYTVVKSKNRPSIFEIASPSTSPTKPQKRIRDMRKSLMYFKRGTEDSSSATSNADSRGLSATSQPTSKSSVDIHQKKSNSESYPTPEKPSKPAIIMSPKLEARPDDKANTDSKAEAVHTSRTRRLFDKFKSLFSWNRDAHPPRELSPQATDKDKDPQDSSDDSSEQSRHVKWSDSKSSPSGLTKIVEPKQQYTRGKGNN